MLATDSYLEIKNQTVFLVLPEEGVPIFPVVIGKIPKNSKCDAKISCLGGEYKLMTETQEKVKSSITFHLKRSLLG